MANIQQAEMAGSIREVSAVGVRTRREAYMDTELEIEDFEMPDCTSGTNRVQVVAVTLAHMVQDRSEKDVVFLVAQAFLVGCFASCRTSHDSQCCELQSNWNARSRHDSDYGFPV